MALSMTLRSSFCLIGTSRNPFSVPVDRRWQLLQTSQGRAGTHTRPLVVPTTSHSHSLPRSRGSPGVQAGLTGVRLPPQHAPAQRARKCLATARSAPPRTATLATAATELEREVLGALSRILDPDFGTDIVSCGFIKDLEIDSDTGAVAFRMELTTPACPVKDVFEAQAKEYVSSLPWVRSVSLVMSAQPPRPLVADTVPAGLRAVSNIVAVSSCKGGVGKSTVAVNLAYSLALMGARVGLFDADIYGPSLPTMVSPELRVLQMDPETRAIFPTEFEGVKLVSFGFTGQGSAIMRGPMVSGVIGQLLGSTQWGELDYLVVDMPPGTGDVQLTLCQTVPLTAAVVVTTPQKLAFIDVAKGVRMFSKLKVPCVAVVENMCYFDGDDGKRYFPFGEGSGPEVVRQFGIPNLFQLPIRAELSASGDSGLPEVLRDPRGVVARAMSDVGVCVVQQCAKLRQQVATAVRYDPGRHLLVVRLPNTEEEFYLHPATVRRNDRSAQSVDEWTGEQRLRYSDVAEDIEPESIKPMGNYAVAVTWPDGFTQVAPFEQLEQLERVVDPESHAETLAGVRAAKARAAGEGEGEAEGEGGTAAAAPAAERSSSSISGAAKSNAAAILAHARSLQQS